MKIYILLFFLISVSLAYGNSKSTDEISKFSSEVDTFLLINNTDEADLEILLKKMQRLNWSRYFDLYQEQGPIKKLQNYCREKKLTAGVISCTNGFGLMYRQLGRSGDAEHQHLEALELSKSTGDTINMLISLNNLGVNARRTDNLKKATDFHMEVLNLGDRFSDQSSFTLRKSKCIALNSLGNINISLKQYSKAIEIFKQSNAIEQTMNSDIGQAVNMANIGEAFELSEQTDSARHYYEQSLSFNEKAGSVLGIALCNNNLGKIFQKEKQFDKALSYFERSIELIRTTGDKYHLIISLESAASIWIEKKQYQRASKLLDEAISLAKETHAKVLLKEAYQMLARINQEDGKYQKAFDFLTLSHQYSDSIFNEENQRHLTEIQTKYETRQKEQQIVLLNKEHELNIQHLRIQRISLWGIGIFSLLVLMVIVLIYNGQKIQSRTREIELGQKLLRSQMNPHFIFNSLGAIQNFMMKNDGRKAAFYLSSFSSLMRSILKNSREEMITLQEEIQTIENYLNLHQLRLGEKLSFSVSVSDELESESVVIPPMLVQPFVENAIIHGIEKMEEKGHISVTFGKENKQLKISVTDNGKGFEHGEQKETHVSYALQIFKERVANLKKTVGAEIIYHIGNREPADAKNPGTLVTVKLPLKFT